MTTKRERELLEILQALLIETNQHATGDCPKLLKACKDAQNALVTA